MDDMICLGAGFVTGFFFCFISICLWNAYRDCGITLVNKKKEFNEKLREKDIFEDMQCLLRCMYISDLPHYKIKILNELKFMNLRNYTLHNLIDFFQYVFQIDIHSYDDIQIYLNQKYMEDGL